MTRRGTAILEGTLRAGVDRGGQGCRMGYRRKGPEAPSRRGRLGGSEPWRERPRRYKRKVLVAAVREMAPVWGVDTTAPGKW